MKLKVAIVGCGKIADGHVEEIKKLGDLAELCAVCDREPEMARQLAVRQNVRASYDDFDQMLRIERPDVVHVATPPHVHVALAKKAILAGAHVLVEKPFALTYEASRELVAFAEAHQKKLCVGYSYHFEPPAETLRGHLAAGRLGEIVHLEAFYGYNLAGPFGAALLGDPTHWVHGLPGKLLQNVLDHPVSKIVEFLPDERPEVSAFGIVRRSARFGDVRDELVDEARVVIRGERASAYVTFSAHVQPLHHFLRVYGTKNTAHVDYAARTCTLDVTEALPSALGRLVPAFQAAGRYAKEGAHNIGLFARSRFHYFAGFGELFARFYRAIGEGGPLPVSHRDILRNAWVLEQIFTQIDAQKTIGPRIQSVEVEA